MKLKEELKTLRYQLESFEVRYAVGSMPEDQYKMMRASLLLRIQEIEELRKLRSPTPEPKQLASPRG
jgi:hypothetical protein